MHICLNMINVPYIFCPFCDEVMDLTLRDEFAIFKCRSLFHNKNSLCSSLIVFNYVDYPELICVKYHLYFINQNCYMEGSSFDNSTIISDYASGKTKILTSFFPILVTGRYTNAKDLFSKLLKLSVFS